MPRGVCKLESMVSRLPRYHGASEPLRYGRPLSINLCCHPIVLIEKPLTPTLAEAQELVDLAREKNLVLAPFQNRRWDADFLAVQGLLKENKVCSVYIARELRGSERTNLADI